LSSQHRIEEDGELPQRWVVQRGRRRVHEKRQFCGHGNGNGSESETGRGIRREVGRLSELERRSGPGRLSGLGNGSEFRRMVKVSTSPSSPLAHQFVVSQGPSTPRLLLFRRPHMDTSSPQPPPSSPIELGIWSSLFSETPSWPPLIVHDDHGSPHASRRS